MHHDLNAQKLFNLGPVIPVLTIDNLDDALPIAEALLAGGIQVLEITLRTSNAPAIIEKLSRDLPEAYVGAGTVIDQDSLLRANNSGADFFISPGVTAELLKAGKGMEAPLVPGISTVSELMMGLNHGYSYFKFFPAEASGGIAKLKAFAGPFPGVRFCPTGGINPQNIMAYLACENVMTIGGSWLVDKEIIKHKNWQEITARSRDILMKISEIPN